MPISPYVERLREAMGNDLLLLPSVSILPRDAEGRILLVKHSYTGQWGLIGGTVEPDESPEDPDGDETTDVGWFGPDELASLDMNSLARALLTEMRYAAA